MVDTIKTTAALLGDLAGGAPSSITAQTMRNAVVTLLGDFTGISHYAASPADFAIADSTLTKFTQFGFEQPAPPTAGASVPDAVGDTVTIGTDGTFLVEMSASFGADAEDYSWSVFLNGSELSPLAIKSRATTAGQSDVVTCAAAAPVALVAGDYLELFAVAHGSGAKTAKVHNAHLSVLRIG